MRLKCILTMYNFFMTSVYVVVLSSINAERPKFRHDYIYEDSYKAFYKVHTIAVPWSEAKIRCESERGQLLVPDSLDEADSVTLLIGVVLHKYAGVYIGIHDLYSLGAFVTINGSSISYSILDLLWESHQPMQSSGRCVAMRRGGKLFVNPCDEPLPFLCKINASSIHYREDCDTYDPAWQLAPNGNCYIAQEEPQTWHHAYASCLAAGGHLAVLNSRSEADYLRDLFKKLPEYRRPDNDFAFLGFTDLFRKHHYWTVHGDTLHKTGYVDWDLKCKDAGIAIESRCGGLRRSGLLSTAPCNLPAAFFCEKSLNTSKQIGRDSTIQKLTHIYEKFTNNIQGKGINVEAVTNKVQKYRNNDQKNTNNFKKGTNDDQRETSNGQENITNFLRHTKDLQKNLSNNGPDDTKNIQNRPNQRETSKVQKVTNNVQKEINGTQKDTNNVHKNRNYTQNDTINVQKHPDLITIIKNNSQNYTNNLQEYASNEPNNTSKVLKDTTTTLRALQTNRLNKRRKRNKSL